jgi:hypothetical protein
MTNRGEVAWFGVTEFSRREAPSERFLREAL